jgi:hypothetical protein
MVDFFSFLAKSATADDKLTHCNSSLENDEIGNEGEE